MKKKLMFCSVLFSYILYYFLLYPNTFLFAQCKVSSSDWYDIHVIYAGNKENKKERILLIGDSISKQYYGKVKNMLLNYAVCLFSTSSCGASDCFKNQLKFVLSSTDFKIIHFNDATLHCLGADNKLYEENLIHLIKIIRQLQPTAKLIIATATAAKTEEINKSIVKKNKIILEVAKKYHIEINDLFGKTNKPELHRDTLHFNHNGVNILANLVAEKIKDTLVE